MKIRSTIGRAVLIAALLVGAVATVQAVEVSPAAAVTTPTLEVFQPETLAQNMETTPLKDGGVRATLVVAHPADWNLYQWRYSRRTAVEGVGSYVNVDAGSVRTIGIGNGANYTIFEAVIPTTGFSNWGFTGSVRWLDVESRIDLRFRQGTSTTYADLNNNSWTWQALTETQSTGQEDPAVLYETAGTSRNTNLGNGGSVSVSYRCDDNDSSGANDNCDHGYIRLRSVNSGTNPTSFGSIVQLNCGSAPVAGAPCEGSNSPGAFNADDGTLRSFSFTPDPGWGRGRWVIEARMCGEDQRGNINNCIHGGGWQNMGSYYVNDGQAAPTFGTPTFTGGGNTVGGVLRPNTGATVNYPVNSADAQVVGWDDDNNGSIDAWNYGEGSTNGQPLATTAQKTRSIDTSARAAGSSCRIRTQVTDNGGLNAADPSRNTSAVVQGPDCRVNTPPAGANQGPLNATKGTALAISLANTDATDGDARTCELVTSPGKGSVTGFNSCSVSYTANANTYGTDSFTYRVRDDHNGVSATYTVSLAIVNRAPTATPQSVSVDAGVPTAITLAGTDLDGDSPLTCAAPNPAPTKGSLTGTGCSRTYTSAAGTANDGVGGADSFGFTVSDAAPSASATATVGVTVRNPDLGLTKSHTGRFNPGTGSGTYTLALTNTANSVASGTTTIVDTLPAGMTYRSFNAGTSGFTCSGTPGVSTTVTCTRATPIPKPFSDSLAITVDVTEGAASPATNQAVVSNLYELAATAGDNTASDPTVINRRPVATGSAAVTDVDAPVVVGLTGSDPDGDPLTYSIVSGPSHGSLSGAGATRQYTPDTGYVGVDSFTFLVTDDGALSSSTVTVKLYVGVSDVKGTVTSTVGGTPLAGIEVRLIDNADVANPVLVATGTTAANGTYDLAAQFPAQGAVPFGTYVLRFVDPTNDHISEYHLNAPNRTTATNVVLDASATGATVDADLVPGARVQGIVRSAASGNAPIAGLQVRLAKVGQSGSSAVTTDSGGRYAFELLTAGSYQLWFRDVNSGQWISEWWDEQTTQANATPIVVATGEQRVINEELQPVAPPPPADAGTISGTVTSSLSGHAPIAGIQVRLYKAPYTTSTATTTDANGNYSFGDLAPGSYKVWYRVISGNQFASEYWNDKVDLASADPIVLDNDSVLADAELTPPGQTSGPQVGAVSGRVTQLDGTTPIAGIQVRLYVAGQTSGSTATTTDANGNYSFAGRPVGSYQVWFRDVNSGQWFSEWHLDQASQASATPVAVTNGQTTTVDARLTAR